LGIKVPAVNITGENHPNRQLKIGIIPWHVGSFDLVYPGGVLVVSLKEAECLAQQGHRVRVFGQEVTGVHPLVDTLRKYNWMGRRRRLAGIGEFALRTLGWDILHGVNMPILARYFSRRSLVYYQNSPTTLSLDDYERHRAAYRCGHYAFCSAFLKQQFLALYPDIPENQCYVLHNAVDIDQFQPCVERPSARDGIKRILFMAAWTMEKGIGQLPGILAALEKLRPQADYRFILAGSTDYWQIDSTQARENARIMAELGSRSPTVEVVGKLTRTEAARSMREADLFLSPVTWPEPFGLTIVEAMASQTPVIASALGGIPEIIDHTHTGLLMTECTPQQFAEAINNLLDDPEGRERIGLNARQSVMGKFTWDVHTKTLLEIYGNIKSYSSDPTLKETFPKPA
jgi:glycosyltransferase involved in cell wall biosynthesis